MSREVCGICWCPYDEDTGECACAPEPSAPPQRKPLTDEQKQAIHNETGAGHSLICLVESYINGIKE